MMDIVAARVYDQDQPAGYRVLVDRVWPRGLTKAAVAHDEWLVEVAPSAELRKWFAHDGEKWEAFVEKYRAELAAHDTELRRLRALAKGGTLVLLYSARDRDRNQAVALKEILEGTTL